VHLLYHNVHNNKSLQASAWRSPEDNGSADEDMPRRMMPRRIDDMMMRMMMQCICILTNLFSEVSRRSGSRITANLESNLLFIAGVAVDGC